MDMVHMKEQLSKNGQQHLLSHWNDLNQQQRQVLMKELQDVDLDYVMESFRRCTSKMTESQGKLDDRMEPLPKNICGSVLNVSEGERSCYERLAYEKIVEGKMGILLLAGGQGTRLGVSYPKGMYDIGLPSGKSLFQLQAERIIKLESLAREAVPKKSGDKAHIVWYIMTSASTLQPTVEYFRKHDYFGLDPDMVVVFEQGTLPCFSLDGKILMSSKYQISRAPDGNGGLYRALKTEKVLEDMEKRGVEFVQLYCVDNALVRVGDPVFAGYCLSKSAECGNKVVAKGFPSEAVGITCKVDGRYQVVEYSEITNRAAERRNPDGSLTYSAANICVHFFTLEFLKRIAFDHENELTLHVAKKKIPCVDPTTGSLVTPEKPNGIKMEKFVFDVFQFAENNSFANWECIREDEFAPLKNAEGASDFSPSHCRNAVFALHQKYITAAGGVLVDDGGKCVAQMRSPAEAKETNNNDDDHDKNNNEDEKDVVVCEISPLVSYAGEGLEEHAKGKKLVLPVSLTGTEA